MTRTVKTSSGGGGDLASFEEGQFAMVTATGVSAVKDTREKEREDMKDLNDRFANYIEKVSPSRAVPKGRCIKGFIRPKLP